MAPTTTLDLALNDARGNTDRMFTLFRPDAFYERPVPERHRIVFYLGHLEAFDWNLCREPLGLDSFHPTFDRLFAFGIDPKVGDTPDDAPSDWPAIDEIREYARRVRDILAPRIAELPEQLVNVAVEHRLMHAETFAYMLHNLPIEAKTAPASEETRSGPNPPHGMIDIPAGEATLGRPRGDGFGWDNEFNEHRVAVPAFAIAKRKVTNGDYLEFVRAGARPPHFWLRRGADWFYRGMFGEIALPLDWPVYVTRGEAAAYAQWRGKALPTEAQFHRAAFGTPQGEERLYPWGGESPGPEHGNFEFARWDPAPVTATPKGDSAFGVSQMIGNGWEWTASVFEPFAGFEPFPFYPGYSANFFDGVHYVLKGGSPRTAARLLRRSFRNWFRSDYPYAYAAFRLAEN